MPTSYHIHTGEWNILKYSLIIWVMVFRATEVKKKSWLDGFPWCLRTNTLTSYWNEVALFLLQWCHNECHGISNHWCLDCLLNRLFRHRSKKTSKLHITALCEGNSLVTSEFSARRASNGENVSIWWHHYVFPCRCEAKKNEDLSSGKYQKGDPQCNPSDMTRDPFY